ncbi:MAG: hypothetical protein QOI31_738 [Solirubrobacterales bacterium]|jgi:hypothetical protein|nr:hypothetical protein [Solirubrobacterales bacterium]
MKWRHFHWTVLLGLGLVAILVIGCGGGDDLTGEAGSPAATNTIPQPTEAQLAAAGLDKLPVAPEDQRIDIEAPTFSNPTEITNPLFPISDLHSAIFSGRIEGQPFHTETTLLPQTRIIEWGPGQQVETLVSQYVAYIDGRIEEVALDHYAQADDGSVWYMGEDVLDYDPDGFIDSTEGTWLAGREGPAEMIMPADPQIGDVHRAENIPGIAFEEVTIKALDKTVDGPAGPVEGAMIARELHDDGTHSDKVFAPGYGEFFSGHGSEIEAMALAVPTDALDSAPPTGLEKLSASAEDLFDASSSGNWKSAAISKQAATHAWDAYDSGQVPPRLAKEMELALSELAASINARDQAQAGYAAIDVAQSTLDLELRYRKPAEIDLARFELWARQVLVDAAAADAGGVRSDVAAMEWTRDRFAHTLDPADLTAIDAHLIEIRDSVANEVDDLRAATAATRGLRDILAGIPSAQQTP